MPKSDHTVNSAQTESLSRPYLDFVLADSRTVRTGAIGVVAGCRRPLRENHRTAAWL